MHNEEKVNIYILFSNIVSFSSVSYFRFNIYIFEQENNKRKVYYSSYKENQNSSDNMLNVKAWSDIYLLGLSDALVPYFCY